MRKLLMAAVLGAAGCGGAGGRSNAEDAAACEAEGRQAFADSLPLEACPYPSTHYETDRRRYSA